MHFSRLFLAVALAAATWAAPAVRIVSVEPTALYPRGERLRQVAYVTVDNPADTPLACEIVARIAAGEAGPAVAASLPPGSSRHRLLVPEIKASTQVEITVRAQGSGETIARLDSPWQPQRKWKIFIVKSSHEDLGYEDYIFHKQHDIANFVDIARNIGKPAADADQLDRKSDSRYHYTMESLLFQRNYIEERGERAWRNLVEKDIKTGNLNLMGAPSGVHSHWMDYEELARMTYPGRREAKDRFGLDLKTFMIVDNPSLSWSGAQAVSDAGFRYVARWGQKWRTGGNNDYQHTKLPALFWWQAPDGVHRVLFGWRSEYGASLWYGQPGGGYGNFIDLASDHLSKHLKQVEAGAVIGPYPYDALIHPEYVDHDIPRIDRGVLSAWNSRYAYPEIHIANPDHFFAYIEKKYGPELPVLSGDLNNFSADYATIDPESQGWKRQASRMLPAAEGVAVLASLLRPGYLLSPAAVDRIYTRMFDYDEHSWPTLPPSSDVQLFNAAWVKKEEARRALVASEAALADAARQLGGQIRTGPVETIAVFNSLAHPRTAIARAKGAWAGLTDLTTGQRVACQQADGEVLFLASDVPAFGYKLYRVERTSGPAAQDLETGRDFIANRHYRIRFDAATGGVASIIERSTGKELVDPSAPYRVNQMIWVHKQQRESLDGINHTTTPPRKMEASKGPVMASFDVWIDDKHTQAAIRQTVTLYAGVKRIDFVNRLDHARVLFSKNHEDRYKENIFYAFPFAVDGGQPRVEYPGGVVRPFTDQLRWGSHDFLYANRWVDVSNRDHGVTLSPWNAGTFEFGEIRYNRFSINYQPSKPWLFSHAWSNRMAELLTLNGDDCNAVLGYSMTSHTGDWDSGEATSFAWSNASPLVVSSLPASNTAGELTGPARGFLSVDAPGVQLTVLKSSEQPGQGWVARLVETHGKATGFTLDASALKVNRAQECDLVENNLHPLPVEDGKVKVSIRPFGFATVRLESGSAPGAVSGLAAQVKGDDSVALSWNAPSGSAAAYNVYRSDDPGAPPTAHTLVARTTTPSFVDHRLHIKTRYYYRVAPVSAGNLQGPVADPVDVMPDGPNVTPPAPVAELGVVRRDKSTLMVYWRTNAEPDLARYRVYRGESPGFSVDTARPLATIEPARQFLQMHVDRHLQAGKTYYYKVLAEDWAGNRQAASPEASATTPAY